MFPFLTRKRRLLVVCRANLCRSPMAEGVLRQALARRGLRREFAVDSAGTQVATPGRRPDVRAVRLLAREGIDISRHRARAVARLRPDRFERILAVDEATHRELLAALPPALHGRLGRLADYAPAGVAGDLPDPHFGPEEGFREVLRQIEALVPALLEDLGRAPEAAPAQALSPGRSGR